ncbi:MAG TPA: OmpA family protein [Pyrinomonadaceae bacterium]|nr:OmpA family protein [Pyrinomonadaceae bacterium]
MSHRDDDEGPDYGLTVPDLRSAARGRARNTPPPEEDFDRTQFNLPSYPQRGGQRQQPPEQPPPHGSFDLTSVNFTLPPPERHEDEDHLYGRPSSAPQPPQHYPPPSGYAQPPYPPQPYAQQQQYSQQQYPPQQPYAQPQYESPPTRPADAPPEPARRRVPAWAWAGGGLAALLLVTALVAALYFFWPFGSTFTLKVLNAPRGSQVYVDEVRTGVSQADGSINIQSLRAGEQREVRVTHEGYADWRTTVRGERGEVRELRVKLTPLTQEPPKPAESEITKDLEEMGRARVYGINFDTGSDVINPDSRPVLDRIVGTLKQRPGWKLTVEGHTDSTASAAFNQQLSERRALAVKNYLQANGIEASRLSTVGYGASKPISDNGTVIGRALNRRVELIRQ